MKTCPNCRQDVVPITSQTTGRTYCPLCAAFLGQAFEPEKNEVSSFEEQIDKYHSQR